MLLLTSPLVAQESTLPDTAVDALSRRDYAGARAALEPLAAEATNAEAQYQYGLLLLEGRGGPVRADQGRALLEQSAAQDHAAAALMLARVYLTGQSAGVERDPAKAAALLNIAVAQGNPEAQYYLALLTRAGTGVTKDAVQAFELMKQSAEAGHTEAQHELSKAYAEGKGTDPDGAQALHWLHAAAEAGKTEAQFLLANALEHGQGAVLDKPEALRWYRRAAEGGMPIAQRILGTKYLQGTDEVAADPDEALRWLSSAAHAGDPGAMNNLAIAYGGANGVPRNDTKALEWFRRASDTGLARATYSLAQYHEQGRGMAADLKAAALLYRLALEQGDERGALRLGYLAGQGALDTLVPPHFSVDWALAAARTGDADALAWLARQAEDGLRPAQTAYGEMLLTLEGRAAEAAAAFERAALAGDVPAQFQLGTLYTTGTGVPLDYVAAHLWLNIAATSGHKEAAETRELIGNLMTPEQISSAQTQAREFFDTASERLPEAAAKNRTRP
jgi:TPR repeat protein